MDEFILDKAYEIMEKKILKEFIRERGFKKSIPHFQKIIEKRGWEFICQHLPYGFVALVREFYKNLVERKETQCFVKEKWVSFHKKDTN